MRTTPASLLVDYPCFQRLPEPGSPRVGAEADVRAAAGLVALLETSLPGHPAPMGAGYQAPLTIPFGLAVTAAIGALGAPDPLQDRWMVRSAVIEWQACARGDEVIDAHGAVERVDEREAVVAASARGSGGREVLRTRVRLVPMLGGRYAAAAVATRGTMPERAANAPADDELARGDSGVVGLGRADAGEGGQPLWRLRPPRILAAGPPSEVAFEPDLLKLLTHPVAGHPEPLGRRTHPLGGAPLGAALTTALVAAGERDANRPSGIRIVRAEATWYRALSPSTGWVGRSRGHAKGSSGHVVVDVVGAGSDTALTARVSWTSIA